MENLTPNILAFVLSGILMYLAVWFPALYGNNALWVRIIWTMNFIGFIINWTIFVSKGGLS